MSKPSQKDDTLEAIASCEVCTAPGVSTLESDSCTRPSGVGQSVACTRHVVGSLILVMGCGGAHGFGCLPWPAASICSILLGTQIADAGCAALASALDTGAMPALETLYLFGTRASAAAKYTVREALLGRATSRAATPS